MDEPPSPFFQYSYPPSTDKLPSPTNEPPTATDELPPSPLLKSRIPRKTIIVDPNLFKDDSRISYLHCPLRKGIIYYCRDGAIFEHNIHSYGKYEPRIIVPTRPGQYLEEISFVPIKGNRILLFAKYLGGYLHLSIHKIRSDHRVGPALWSFNGSIDGHSDIDNLVPITSTENALGITFMVQFNGHWKLFDISTNGTDASNNIPLIESRRIDFDQKLARGNSRVKLFPDRHILLNTDVEVGRRNETIDIYYSDSGDTNNMNFSFVTRMSIPLLKDRKGSFVDLDVANGSKFAMATSDGRVSVWDIRSTVPLKTFMKFPKSVRYLQFNSGNPGKEVLVFVERDNLSPLDIIHVIDATSFETEEMLPFKSTKSMRVGALFFDPSGGTLYAEHTGTLYEWHLQKNEPRPEWWIGE
ncbi:hypothetical protein K443DRAFT_681748 [Laccaria amethystina LaAM-08-1]|uniref:Unplaced genomic scaffold K443scaffold_165, whole genome shotgun sequence n=1 Tax=Laccaria amethystina LaAM-08-1 TaxID=1095629 RepID=A0A0C9XM60_9AGAR|nr:hypothetical protein K443DRAFT_681748 [Laccaria amethystina LaAM-08-1]